MYQIDPSNGDIVITGSQNGIGDSPYDGFTDLKNVNIISVPNEASVGFATTANSLTLNGGTVTSASGTTLTYTGAANLPTVPTGGFALQFTSVDSYSGISTATPYWMKSSVLGQMTIYSDYALTTPITVTGTGNATFTFYTVNFSNYQGNQPNKFCRSSQTGYVFMVDAIGQVWTNTVVAGFSSIYFRFAGNTAHVAGDSSSGNGIVYYKPTGASGYIFVFSDSSIDYFQENGGVIAWQYGWQPSTASNNNAGPYLNAGGASGASHEALVGQDNVVYYCDSNYIGSFFEVQGSTFSPTSAATFTQAKQALEIPIIDQCLCLAELGINLLVGGARNLIYPWNRTGTVSGLSILNSYSYPIFLSESVVQKMITINTNTYIFVGNRGRIYVTNGSQASLWKKLPDHVSGTVEPYFQWGGVVSTKNQMYFSALATTNGSAALSTYGGLWAIDMDTQAIRLVNQLSYGTYAGYSPALFAIVPLPTSTASNPSGYGLLAGWNSGASTYGIDGTVSTPYTGGQSVIVSDMIPVGTLLHENTPTQVEFKLARPLLAGESVQLLVGSSFADYANNTFTNAGTTTGTGVELSGNFGMPIQGLQWLLVKAILTGTGNGSPSQTSFNRVVQLRVIGSSVKITGYSAVQ